MLWTERSIRAMAASETAAVLKSEVGRNAICGHLPSLVHEPSVLAALRAILIDLLAEDEAKPLAERVTTEVRSLLTQLEGQIDRAIKAERKKIAEQKAEMLEKAKEELRLAIVAQKSLTTRQVNEHVKQHERLVSQLLERMEARLKEALAEADARIAERRATSLVELRAGLDKVLAESLETFALQAVRRHVEERPVFGPQYTNRELARINGISIREVKRRRRCSTLAQG